MNVWDCVKIIKLINRKIDKNLKIILLIKIFQIIQDTIIQFLKYIIIISLINYPSFIIYLYTFIIIHEYSLYFKLIHIK